MRFLLIDRVTGWEPGQRATATKNVALSEDFLDDHCPDNPIMPGALILEGLAQLGGLLLQDAVSRAHNRKVKALLSLIERAKFRMPVMPGDQIEYNVRITSLNELAGRLEGQGTCAGNLVAECVLVFAFQGYDSPRLERRQEEIVDLWMRGLPKRQE